MHQITALEMMLARSRIETGFPLTPRDRVYLDELSRQAADARRAWRASRVERLKHLAARAWSYIARSSAAWRAM